MSRSEFAKLAEKCKTLEGLDKSAVHLSMGAVQFLVKLF